MIGDNIRYYREVEGRTQKSIAEQIGISAMAMSNYENNKRQPSYDVLHKLSKALHIGLAKLLSTYNDEVAISHGAFRKESSLTKEEQKDILFVIDNYLGRFFNLVSILGEHVLPDYQCSKCIFTESPERDAQTMRKMLDLPSTGPIGNFVDILENLGFIICSVEYSNKFSGNNGIINGRPYIAVNSGMAAERQRFTIAHELVHILFDTESASCSEKQIDAIAGAFLFPEEDVKRELGFKRTDIFGELRIIQKEYGISMASAIIRAHSVGVINSTVYKEMQNRLDARGLRFNEQSGLIPEKSRLLEQLTIRAVAEDEITVSKAAEILDVSLWDARILCYGGAV